MCGDGMKANACWRSAVMEDMTGDLLHSADSYQRWLMRDTAVAITVEDKSERYAALSVERWPRGAGGLLPPVASNQICRLC